MGSVFAGLLCLSISLFVITIMHNNEKRNIAEIGYRLRDKKNKLPQDQSSFFGRVLYWHFCKNAKYDRNIVWVYFSCNVFCVLCGILAVVLFVFILVFCNGIYEMTVYQLSFLMLCVLIWAAVHFVIDLCFLPSERKRYGITGNRKKKK